MVKTERDALGYIKRALNWAKVDLNKIYVHDLPNYLEAYDQIEPVTQEEANVVMGVIMKVVERKLAQA